MTFSKDCVSAVDKILSNSYVSIFLYGRVIDGGIFDFDIIPFINIDNQFQINSNMYLYYFSYL